MRRDMLALAIVLSALSCAIGCSKSECSGVSTLPALAITQRQDHVACFLDRKLPEAERLAAADRLQADNEQIDFILPRVPELLAIARSGDEPQSTRCRALHLLTVCACVHPREGCESAILSVVNDDTATRHVRAAGAILLFQLPASNWDVDFLMDVILHEGVPEAIQKEAIETSTPLFVVAPDRSFGLCRRLLKCATTKSIHPSVRSAALNALEFHGVHWLTDNDEWMLLRSVGDTAIALILDSTPNVEVRQSAFGVGSSVHLCASDQTAVDWDDYRKKYVRALSQILMNDSELEEMRTAAVAACRFLGKSVAQELLSTFETGLFTGSPATQRHVIEAIAAGEESRDLWLPLIDRYIVDVTRDSDVRERAVAVRRTMGAKRNL